MSRAAIVAMLGVPQDDESWKAEADAAWTGVRDYLYDGVIELFTYTTSQNLAVAHAGGRIEMDSSSPLTLTILANSSVAMPLKTNIGIFQLGTGQLTVVYSSPVAVRSVLGKTSLSGQNSGATLFQRAINDWVLEGDLA